jgi:small-conductance mechanosensitive channel
MDATGRMTALLLAAQLGALVTAPAMAQQPEAGHLPRDELGAAADRQLSAPSRVDVTPVARDQEIRQRLQGVLEATDWFVGPRVRVEQGVVFLEGRVQTGELKKWAGDLARNTQDVVAVANQMQVIEPPIWDFQPAWNGLRGLWRDLVRSLPLLLLGLLILLLSTGVGWLATRATRSLLRQRLRTNLLRNVIARAAGLLVVLAGVYLVLRVSGLTQLALTVVGGTGLVGLILGIAFREITENFLASIFLSMQRPFETGDLVEVSGVTGYVQQLNMRTTIVMTLEGNLVQIPNATVYKSNLRNFTTNANRREDFVVGIGYENSINEAQEIARRVLADHPAVLKQPESSVLADSMGPATINLRMYFWLDGREHSWLKVRSSVIRLVKRAFQKHGISMPDDAREVVFPEGVPVTMVEGRTRAGQGAPERRIPADLSPDDVDAASTQAEAGLYSEAGTIEEQARQVQPLRDQENLLDTIGPAGQPRGG